MSNMENKKCEICGDHAVLKENKCSGYQEGMSFQIYLCTSCNSSFALPRVDVQEIYNSIYTQTEIVPGYDRYYKYANEILKYNNPLEYLTNVESTYWSVAKALDKITSNKQSEKILEIGSGLGYLTYSLKKAGYDILGLDISEEAVSASKRKFGDFYICQDIFNYNKTHANYYDIIILTEVIEHVENPLEFISEIIKLLKPLGSIILTTPNKSLFPKEVIWKTDLPPIHYWWLSEDSIERLCLNLNMKFQFINFSEYYSKNYQSLNIKTYKKDNFRSPILNIHGKRLRTSETKRSQVLQKIYNSKIFDNIRYLYRYLRDSINQNYVRCDKKGVVMCAIIQKQN